VTLTTALHVLVLVVSLRSDPVDCTFANPRYAGQCVERVTPAGTQTPVQACSVLLQCLNNPQCIQTYCRSTNVRGGWTLVSPKPKKK